LVVDETILDQVVRLLFKIPSQVLVRKTCRDSLKISDTELDAYVLEARRQLTLAVDFHRDEELGKAIIRFDNIYSDAYKLKDHKTALNAEKERVKLLGLHKPPTFEEGESVDGLISQAIRDHLAPLHLAPDDTPVEELVRLAALEIVRYKAVRHTTEPQS